MKHLLALIRASWLVFILYKEFNTWCLVISPEAAITAWRNEAGEKISFLLAMTVVQ